MSGCIVRVWFEPESEDRGRPARWSFIETELEDFATFCEMVDGDRFISGAVLWTMNDRHEQHTKIIRERQPIAFRGSAVLRCELPRLRFVEEEPA